MTDKVLLTIRDAAEALSLSESTVYDLAKTGELRTVVVGRARRVPVAALAEFVAALDGESTPTQTQSVELSASEIPPGLLTIKETAVFMRLSRRTIFNLMERGDLPSVRIGRSVRVDPADVAALVEKLKDSDGAAPRQRRSPSQH